MEAVMVWVACVTAALSGGCALGIALAWRASARRAQAEIAELRARLDGLDAPSSRYARTRGSRPQKSLVASEPVVAEFLITDAGLEPQQQPEVVSSRLVLSAAVGEPLVKFVSLVHGVRVALAPENRNRIRFEMRREIRRARKARRAAGRAAAAKARSQAVGS